jgi:hypothetical protein
MRLRDALQALAPVVWAIALALVVSRKRLVRSLTRDGAVDAPSARPIPAGGLSGFWRKRLLAAGVLQSVDGERLWLDTGAWDAYMRVRRRRGLTIGIVLAAGLLVIAALAKVR